MKCEVIQGEAVEAMRGMAESRFALIVADPPYFKVKGDDWDNQWRTPEEYLAWLSMVCAEWKRILKPNGSLYVFASPQMARKVGNVVAEHFQILNDIRWEKREDNAERRHNAQLVEKGLARSYYPTGERIIFAEQYGTDNMAKGEAGYAAKCDELRGFVFEPIRAYLDGERRRAGLNFESVRRLVGCADGSGLPSHWFTLSQWMLPTATNYAKLQTTGYFQRPYSELRQEYESLREQYEHLRQEYEHLRRPFTVSADVPYTDVWDFPTVQAYAGKHPCEKPLAMLEHIIRASSREGDEVLDSFAGSFSTGDAALKLNRSFTGVEGSAHWCERGRFRLAKYGKTEGVTVHNETPLVRASYRPAKVERELPLFAEAVA